MIFQDKKSGLVKLTDSVKVSIEDCFQLTSELINHYKKYQHVFDATSKITNDTEYDEIFAALDKKQELSESQKLKSSSDDRALQMLTQGIPTEEVFTAGFLRGKLDQRAISVVLNCVFCIESYTKSFYYFFKEDLKDSISRRVFETLKTRERLERIAPDLMKDEFGFPTLLSVDLEILNNYRNDIAHDNITNLNDDRARSRYKGQLPDTVLGSLNLSHTIFAADTYWKLVNKIHNSTGLSKESFHKHYNLSPWLSSDFELEVRKSAEEFSKIEPFNL